ncbi:insulinase family protein [Candidatus Saccharibacteria bacterium]|nr:insulinase family protein [Candidatus Saccharibacteria bacterium]
MKHAVNEVVLKNGAKGLLINVPGASVTSYELNFRAGDYLSPAAKKWETAHVMEHVILGANEDYPDTQAFQAEIHKNGAYTNAYTSYYNISYVGEVADFEWERVIRLQMTALAKPLFLEAEFAAEVGNIRDEMVGRSNQHFWSLAAEMTKAFGFKIPSDKERSKLIDNVTRDDIVEHYKRTHFIKNLRFIVAGDLRGRRSALKDVIESIAMPVGVGRHKLPVEKAKKPPKPVFVANKSVPNIYLGLSSVVNDKLSIPEDDALGIARIMLTETLYSKIFGQAREKGLVYAVHSGHHQNSRYAEWSLSTQVLPQNASALCDIILREIKKVQKGLIDDSDLEAAKQYALGSFQRSMQTVGSIAGAYERYFFDSYIEDMRTIPDRIKAVSHKDISAVMNRIFADDIGGIGILGGVDSTIAQHLHDQLQPLWRV